MGKQGFFNFIKRALIVLCMVFVTNAAVAVDYKFTAETNNYDKIPFGLSAAGTFYVNCVNGTLKQGDTILGTGEVVIDRTNNTALTGYTCYSTKLQLGGTAENYSTDQAAITFDYYNDMNPISSIDGDLSAIFPYINQNPQNGRQPRFNSTFAKCKNLTSVPNNLFAGYTTPATRMFYNTFSSSGLTTIPATLFYKINSSAAYVFASTFAFCNNLQSIPGGEVQGTGIATGSKSAGLFMNVPNADPGHHMFDDTFLACSSLSGFVPMRTFGTIIAKGADMRGLNKALFGALVGYDNNMIASCPYNTISYGTISYDVYDSQSGLTSTKTHPICGSSPVKLIVEDRSWNTNVQPREVYLKLGKGWYRDENLTQSISSLGPIPTKPDREFQLFGIIRKYSEESIYKYAPATDNSGNFLKTPDALLLGTNKVMSLNDEKTDYPSLPLTIRSYFTQKVTCDPGKYFSKSSSSSCISCPAGYYCSGGEFDSSDGSVQGITGIVDAGYYSTGGATSATPSSSDCLDGYTCGVVSAGYFSSGGATSATPSSNGCLEGYTCGIVSAGYFSTGGATSATPSSNGCLEGHTCGIVSAGYFSTGGATSATPNTTVGGTNGTGNNGCLSGYKCGLISAIRYGLSGATSAQGSGAISTGYFSTGGATSATPNAGTGCVNGQSCGACTNKPSERYYYTGSAASNACPYTLNDCQSVTLRSTNNLDFNGSDFPSWTNKTIYYKISNGFFYSDSSCTTRQSYSGITPTATGYDFQYWQRTVDNEDYPWVIIMDDENNYAVLGDETDAYAALAASDWVLEPYWGCATGYNDHNNDGTCSLATYTITYNLNGGSIPVDAPASYNVTSSAITLPTPTKIGYTFVGWCNNSALTSNCTTSKIILAGSTGNKTYYAKWTPNTYTVTYVCGTGATGNAPANGTATYDANFTPAANNTCTKTGYAFAGWNDGTANWTAGTAKKWTYSSNKTFTAQWTTLYILTFDNGTGGSGGPGAWYFNSTGVYTDNYGATVAEFPITATPIKSGYTFAGYSYNGNTVINSDGSKGDEGFWGYYLIHLASSNQTITAQWTPLYTLTFDKNGGSGGLSAWYFNSTGVYTDNYGTAVAEFPITAIPTKAGYTFGGYYTPDMLDRLISPTGAKETADWWTYLTGLTSAQTIKAKWTPKSITCSAGYYLPENSETCTACPAGYYCNGGTFTYNGNMQGRTGILYAGYFSTGGATSATPTSNGNGCTGTGNTCGKIAAGYYGGTGATTKYGTGQVNKGYYSNGGAKTATPTSSSDCNGGTCGKCMQDYTTETTGATNPSDCYKTGVTTCLATTPYNNSITLINGAINFPSGNAHESCKTYQSNTNSAYTTCQLDTSLNCAPDGVSCSTGYHEATTNSGFMSHIRLPYNGGYSGFSYGTGSSNEKGLALGQVRSSPLSSYGYLYGQAAATTQNGGSVGATEDALNTPVSEGNYCWVKITAAEDNSGTRYYVTTPWIYVGETSSCNMDAAVAISTNSTVQSVIAATYSEYTGCEADVYTITLRTHDNTDTIQTIYEKYGTGWYSNSTATSSLSAANVPVRNGYKFRGYYTSRQADLTATGGSGTRLISASGALPSANTFTAGAPLFAAWARDCSAGTGANCTLSLKSNGTVTYTTSCQNGYYNLQNSGKYNPSCTAIAVTTPSNHLTYNGSAQTCPGITVTTPDSGYTIKYGTESGTYNNNTPHTITNAGNTTVYYKVTTSDSNIKTGSYTCYMGKADGSPTLSSYSSNVTYPTTSGSFTAICPETSTINARSYNTTVADVNVSNQSTGATINITYKQAGTATIAVWCDEEMENYTNGSTVEHAVTVNNKVITINKNGGTGTCGGVASTSNGSITCTYAGTCTAPTWNSSSCNITNGSGASQKVLTGWRKNSASGTRIALGGTATAATTLYAEWSSACSITNGTATSSVSSNTPTCAVSCTNGYSQNGYTNTTTSFNVTGTQGVTKSASCLPRTYKVTLDPKRYTSASDTAGNAATTNGTTSFWYVYKKAPGGGHACYYFNKEITSASDAASSANCIAGTNGVSITAPTLTGYTFNGYYNTKPGTGTQYVTGAGATTNNLYNAVAGNSTLYADWEPNTYTITLNNSYTIKEVYNTKWTDANGNTITSVSIPTSANHVFGGYVDNGGNVYIPASGVLPAPTTFTTNKSLYADFTQECTCTKGDNVSTCEVTGVSNNKCQYSYTCNSGYHVGSSGTNTTGTFEGSAGTPVTLLPNCNVNTYTITYNSNAPSGKTATGSTATSTHTYDTAKALTANGYKVDGYLFFGWGETAGATTPAYNDKESVINLVSTNGGSKTLYAIWKPAPFSVTTKSTATSLQFRISAAGTFYVDCGDGGTLTSSANDINGNTITRSDTTYTNYTCTWGSAGAHTVKFGGTATDYSTDTSTAAISFNMSDSSTWTDSNAYKIASIAGNLSTIFPYKSGNTQDGAQPRFVRTFQHTGITSFPDTLFSGYTTASTHMFDATFANNYSLTGIPATLFSTITTGASYMFYGTFSACTKITSIPATLFSSLTTAKNYMFHSTFYGCTKLESIPATLFDSFATNSGANGMFYKTFGDCPKLTTVPAGLFNKFTLSKASLFKQTFQDCTSLTSVPADLFAGMSSANVSSTFYRTFDGCTSLASLTKSDNTSISYVPSTFLGSYTGGSQTTPVTGLFTDTLLADSCPTGTHTDTLSQTGGKFADAGKPFCEPCAAGTYSDTTGQNSCTTASDGYYVASAGSTSQTECPTGYSGSDNGRDAKGDCFYTCPSKSVNHASSVAIDTAKVYHNGTAYPTCTYTATCNTGYTASGNGTEDPGCDANTYTVAYAGMDGATLGTNPPTSATFDTAFTVNNPTKTGYTFTGWNITGMDSVTHTYGSSTTTNTSISGTKATSFKNLRSTSGTVTFTATWTANTYTVTYKAGQGVVADDVPQSVTYMQPFTTKPADTFSKANATFNKWSSNGYGEYSAEQTINRYNVTQNIVLTATWNCNEGYTLNSTTGNCDANTYTITYNSNAPSGKTATGSTATSTHTYDTAKALTANGYKVDGYLFFGWGETAGATTPAYNDKESVINLVSTNGGSKTLYAIWKPAPFSVTTVSTATSLQFNLSAQGTFYVDCGDGGALTDANSNNLWKTITRNDTTEATYTCTWASAGAHTVRFGGEATDYNTDENTMTTISFWAGSSDANKNANAAKITSIAGNLSTIFPYKTGNAQNGAQPHFRNTFRATSITSIPETLFRGYTTASNYMFMMTFRGCASLVSSGLPATLFSTITTGAKGMFGYTFNGCSNLTTIPSTLFSSLTTAKRYMFSMTFDGCGKLEAIPETLFSSFTSVPSDATGVFYSTFNNCRGLQTVPAGLFSKFTAVRSQQFYQTFSNCTGLTSVPANLFANMASGTANDMFYQTFNGCTSLASLTKSDNTSISYVPSTFLGGYNGGNGAVGGMFTNTQLADSCPSGMHTDTKSQSGGSFADAGKPFCEPCAAGTYTNAAGQSSCTACTAGTYTNAAGQSSCTACPTGYYNTGTGNTSCTPNTYTVVYNKNAPNGVTVNGTMANSSHTYDVAKNLTTNAYTASGYIFVGWATSASATTPVYVNGQSVSNLTTTNNGTVILYAQWKQPKFLLTTTSTTSSFEFDLSASGTFYVDCGDGGTLTQSGLSVLGGVITRTKASNSILTCTWSDTGTHTIRFAGTATDYITDTLVPVIRFYTGTSESSRAANAVKVASISGSLGQIFPVVNGKTPKFYQTFYGCSGLTGSIPANLFSGIDTSNATDTRHMFSSTFYGCSGLTGIIPANLFSGIDTSNATNTKGLFNETFGGCSGLTDIPANLFSGIDTSNATDTSYMFGGTFQACSGLTSVPANLFSGINTSNATDTTYMFAATFNLCSRITSVTNDQNSTNYIPGTFFNNNITPGSSNSSDMFYKTFANTNAQLLSTCPAGTYVDSRSQSGGVLSSAGKQLCNPCTAGTYTNVAGQSSCTACATGSYSSAGASSCTACPASKTTSGTGTAFNTDENTTCSTDCTSIANLNTWESQTWNGETNSVNGLCEVSTCKAGAYKSGNACPVCGNNKYSSAGATSCSSCNTTNGYGNTGTTIASHAEQSSCKTTCSAGYAVLEANAACAIVTGNRYQTGNHTVTYGSTTPTSADVASPVAGKVYTCPAETGIAITENMLEQGGIANSTGRNSDGMNNRIRIKTKEMIHLNAGTYKIAFNNNASGSITVRGFYKYSMPDNTSSAIKTGDAVIITGSKLTITEPTYVRVVFQKSDNSTAVTTTEVVNAQPVLTRSTAYAISGTAATDHDAKSDCKITCPTGTYVASSGGACVPCANGKYCLGGTIAYGSTLNQSSCSTEYTNSDNGRDATTDCFLNTEPKKYVATPSANQIDCATDGYCPGDVKVYYNQTGGRTACDTGLFAPAKSYRPEQCGHKFHVDGANFNDVFYLHSDKVTTPSLNVRWNNKTWYANMTEIPTNMSIDSSHKFKASYGGKIYHICDDTICDPNNP